MQDEQYRRPVRRAPIGGGSGLMTSRPAAALAGLGLVLCATSAAADPCKAIPDRGPMPAYLARGSAFSGPVVYVGDGDSFCVAVGEGQQAWVEVRMEDFYAPELRSPSGPAAKAALLRLAMGKLVSCRAGHRSYDRIVARCELSGRSLGDLMKSAGVAEGGRGR